MRYIFLFFLFLPVLIEAQIPKDSAAQVIKNIYRQAYTDSKSYPWLTTLSKDIGHRLSGSMGAERAVEWSKQVLDTLGLDKVWLQEVMVPHWVRGDAEQVILFSKQTGAVSLNALALGNSIGTGTNGLRGEVIEVKSLDELKSLPDDAVNGKIVFFNRPMDPGLPSTMSAYGRAVDQRGPGPMAAAEKGAIAAVVRSMCIRLDDFPHTGSTRFSETGKNIPAVAISTNAAELLSKTLKEGPAELFIRTTCAILEDKLSYNVIGEIRGTVSPDTVILVGGHLDSWDVGDGSHDDGAGCVQSMEALYSLIQQGYKPRYTIRCVLFMNEENGLRGGKKYAQEAISKNEYHLVAIEADAGGGTPQGFGCGAGADTLLDEYMAHMKTYMDLFEPYNVRLEKGGGGADITDLKPVAGLLIGMRPDNARYFDYHHSANDVLENVHPRELASGAAAMAAFVFLVDQYGLRK